MSQQTKVKLSDWLTCKKELIDLGFKETEINKALRQLKFTLDDLTDKKDFETEPNYYNPRLLSEDFHTCYKKEHVTVKGKCFESCKYKPYQAQTWIIQATYQGLKHGNIIHKLLSNKFEWFNKFKWDIYELRSDDAEIYLKTKFGSLYVPIKSLMKKDPEIIKNRMLDYYGSYRNIRDKKINKCNHKINEHPQNCPKCQQKFYEKEIKPLTSREAIKLFEFMRLKA